MSEDDEADEDVEREDGDGAETDPFSELDVDGDDDSDPFDELDDAPLGERTPATDDDLFEEMDREELADEDGLVESVLEEGVAPDPDSSGETVSASGAAIGPESNGSSGSKPSDAAGEEAGAGEVSAPARDEVVVPKRRYCEGCQYFSDPPETACEHPGTDILELVDTDHFLVADCPVVEWRRELDAYPDPDDSITDPRE